jgi:serine protease Do
MSREQLIGYVDRRGANPDPLEGIWADDEYTYEVGIYRDTAVAGRDYVAFILSTSSALWKPGQVKAEFKKTSDPDVYRTTYFLRNHSKQSTVAMLEDGRMTISYRNTPADSQEQMILTRSYPASEARVRPSPGLGAGGTDVLSIGTGFVVSEDGLVATNYHVVDGVGSLEAYFPTQDKAFGATVVLKDKPNDIVLLRLQGFALAKLSTEAIPYSIGGAGDVGLGGEAYTLGFPLSVVLGKSIKMSDGTISALSGLDDDPRLLQISCPVQPGNCGGPLFNRDGNVVGIVVSSLNAGYFYEHASIIPQNVNFAVKADYLRSLLAMSPGGKDALGRVGRLRGKSVEEQVSLISPFIAAIRSQ